MHFMSYIGGIFLYALIGSFVGTIVSGGYPKEDDDVLFIISGIVWPIAIAIVIGARFANIFMNNSKLPIAKLMKK